MSWQFYIYFTDEEAKTVRSQVPKFTLLIHFRTGFKPSLHRLCSLSSKSTTVMFRWERFRDSLKRRLGEIIKLKVSLGFEYPIVKT